MDRCSVSGEQPTNAADQPVPNNAKRADGQHVDHWVLCPGEIIKAGFVRPVRMKYQHVGPPAPSHPLRDLTEAERTRYAAHGYVKFEVYPASMAPREGRFWTQAMLDKIGKGCGVVTSMPVSIAETYAARPSFYGSTFCCGCGTYLPVGAAGEFVWDGTADRVGT